MSARILVIDDEDLFREDLASLLRQEGFSCRTAHDGETGLQLADKESPDVVLCDLVMPGFSGLEVIERLATSHPSTSVILLTAYGSLDTAVSAFRRGVVDYLLKPVVPEDLLQKLWRCLEQRRLAGELRYLRREVSEITTGTKIVGSSVAMEQVRQLIQKVSGAANIVLITGESGTGKELVARSLHEKGSGSDAPFVAVNCAALPGDLFESALFGHLRGSFTGATEDRAGFFEVATGGTLFLDEIAELPRELQPKLLRAIEQKEIVKVGSSQASSVDVRLVTATNRFLRQEVEQGRFREDLYYRINVLEIPLSPLRERREDIPLLVEHLIHRINLRLGRQILGVDHEAMKALQNAPWKGNVRELENILERAILLSEGGYLGLRDLPTELAAAIHCPTISDDLRAAVRSYEKEHIQKVLDRCGGNREEAARRLGINASTLYRRLKDLEL